jgi:hypothetical protein
MVPTASISGACDAVGEGFDVGDSLRAQLLTNVPANTSETIDTSTFITIPPDASRRE